jgi:hypothetical protein
MFHSHNSTPKVARLALAAGLVCCAMPWLAASARAASSPLVYQTNAVSGGNGNGLIDRHECNALSITIRNVSGGTLTNLWANLGTTTAGAEITQPDSAYADLAAGGANTNTTPFKLSTAVWFPCGTPIDFILTVSNNTGLVALIPFSLSTPTNGVDASNSCPSNVGLGAGLGPDDPQQYGRIQRTGVGTVCATPRPCPGLTLLEIPPKWRHFDEWHFLNYSGLANCVTVELVTRCSFGAFPIFSTAYLDHFNPGDVCANYLGDVGSTPSPANSASYSFIVPPAARFSVVVHEVEPDSECNDYTVTVSSDTGFIEYQPALRIQRAPAAAVVSWPTNAWRFTLEHSSTLASGSFLADTNVAVVSGDNFSITNSTVDPRRFYQLRKLW